MIISKRIVLLIVVLYSLCSIIFPAAAFAQKCLTIGGTGSALASMKILGQAFERAHPGLTVKVLPSIGSTGAIKAVSEKTIDIGISSRPLNEEDDSGIFATLYARSPLIFVANKNVPASNITSEGIIEIYNGEKTFWPHGRRIRTPLRQSNEIDFQIVKKISPEISKAIDVAMSRPGMLTVLTDQENADIIEKTPGAFGISTLAQVIAEKRQLNVLSYNGVRPNMKNLASGKYPLSRFYFVVIQAIMSEPVRQFLAFMRSAHGKSILEENGQVLMVR